MNEGYYEDPMLQLFHDSMLLQIELSKDKDIPAETRQKVLNDLQTSYLTHEHNEKMHDSVDKQTKVLSKVTDQVKKLRDGEGEG